MKYALFAIGLACAFLADAQGGPNPEDFWERSTVYRDEWGVPHVYADSPLTLGFAFGYAQAEDHIAGMLRAYRIANGRAAEVWGESMAKSDEFALQMGHAELAAKAFPKLDGITIELCQGFAYGVNTWLLENPGAAPSWADAVKPEDVLALMHCYFMSQAPYDFPDRAPYPAVASTGNAWAIDATKSKDGSPMLAFAMHGAYEGAFLWYEAHLAMPGYDCEGATIYGLPALLVGHNDNLAWALTPNQADFADVYIEPELRIQKEPGEVNRNAREDAISLYAILMRNVRTYYVNTVNGMQPRQTGFYLSQRGPIVAQRGGRLFSMRAGGYGEFGGLLQLMNMGAAQTMEQFQSALALHQFPSFHVTYADRDGNILYLYNVKTGNKGLILPAYQQKPIEIAGPNGNYINWKAPVPGDIVEYRWGNIVPVAFLPSVVNPESGFVQACGSPPWLATTKSKLKADQWPGWLVGDVDSYRARRVRSVIEKQKLSFDDMQSLLYDTHVPMAADVIPRLVKAATENPNLVKAHPDIPMGLDILRNWNFAAEPESEGMTFFHAWWMAMLSLAGPQFPTEQALIEAVKTDLTGIQPYEFQAIAEAAKMMRNEYATLMVPWGDAHRLRRAAEVRPMPGGSTGEPVFTMDARLFEDKRWWTTYGYTYAMAVRFGETTEAVSVVPFGASDNPASPHYADQLSLIAEQRLKFTQFTSDAVQQSAQSARGKTISLQTPEGDGRFFVQTERVTTTRLRFADTAPASLPGERDAFTAFVTPEITPQDTAAAIAMEFVLSEEQCSDEALSSLEIFAYTPETGWSPLPGQRLDATRRAIYAEDSVVRTYCVLGPATSLRLQMAKAGATPHVPKPATESASPLRSVPFGPDDALDPDIAGDTKPAFRSILGRRKSTERAEGAFGGDQEKKREPRKPKGKGIVPRSPMPERKGGGGVFTMSDSPNNLAMPMPARENPPTGEKVTMTNKSSIVEETDPAAPEEIVPQPETAPADAPLEVAAATPETETPQATTPEPAPIDEETPDASAPPLAESQGEAPEDETPVEERPETGRGITPSGGDGSSPPPGGFTVANMEPRAASQVVWGDSIDIAAPANAGSVHLESKISIQGRIVLYDTAPAPLPNGLTAFTHFAQPETYPQNIPAETAITLRVDPGCVSAKDAEQLVLYAFTAQGGWKPVPGNRVNAADRTYTGLDDIPRLYAVLGPAELLKRPPAPLK